MSTMVHRVRMVDPSTGEVHEHLVAPGDVCPACERKVPEAKADDATARKRDRIVLIVPHGEEGVLDDMLIQLVEKYAEAWPDDARSAREGVGLRVVGERSWKYRAVHFAVYAALTVPGLEPVEEG